jgi:sec-independent protein translocase protein TatA
MLRHLSPTRRERAGIFSMGMAEILVVLFVVLLVFGANKIPALGDGLGRAIRNFKKSMKEDDTIDVTPKKADAPGKGAASR